MIYLEWHNGDHYVREALVEVCPSYVIWLKYLFFNVASKQRNICYVSGYPDALVRFLCKCMDAVKSSGRFNVTTGCQASGCSVSGHKFLINEVRVYPNTDGPNREDVVLYFCAIKDKPALTLVGSKMDLISMLHENLLKLSTVNHITLG